MVVFHPLLYITPFKICGCRSQFWLNSCGRAPLSPLFCCDMHPCFPATAITLNCHIIHTLYEYYYPISRFTEYYMPGDVGLDCWSWGLITMRGQKDQAGGDFIQHFTRCGLGKCQIVIFHRTLVLRRSSQCVCVLPVLSTRRHPAHQVSALILHPRRETSSGVTKLRYRRQYPVSTSTQQWLNESQH